MTYLYRPSEFNYSALNNIGASEAKGDTLIFMNDDIEVPEDEKGVLERLAARAGGERTGAVGIKLLYPDRERIQHCGISLLYSGPSHKLQGYRDDRYYYGYSDHDINVIAVTGAALAIRHDLFDETGGFDERLPVAYNDVDLCMRLFEAGRYNICMNTHHLIHHEGATRSDDRTDGSSFRRLKGERDYFYAVHAETIKAGDPFISRNLTPYGLDFDINLPYEWELSGISDVKWYTRKVRTRKRIHAAIDSFDYRLSDAYGNEDFYEAAGWIFREGRGKLVPCVALEGRGKVCVADAARMRRADVGEVFPRHKKSADSGFIARIPAADIERLGFTGEITVYPVLADKRGHIYKGDEECQKKREI